MSQSTEPRHVEISQRTWLRRLFLGCLAIEVFIALADIFLNEFEWLPFSPMQRFFNITREDSLANWWSASQTLLVGLSLWAIFFLARLDGATRAVTRGWAILASFFTFMAVDDGSKLHERLGSSLYDFAERSNGEPTIFDAFPSYAWQLAIAPFFVLMGLYIAWFLWRELQARRERFMVFAALSLLAIAVALDFVEGTDEGIFDVHVVEHFMKTGEEFLEMLANTVFLVLFLRVLTSRWPHLLIRVLP